MPNSAGIKCPQIPDNVTEQGGGRRHHLGCTVLFAQNYYIAGTDQVLPAGVVPRAFLWLSRIDARR